MQEISGYTIQSTINEGERFTLLQAIRNADQKKVVLKFCRLELPVSDDLTSLQREYQILKQLDSPLVIKIYDLIKQGREIILVLEDIEGKSLKQFLANQAVDLETFFKIALQLTSALGVVHLKNIIHKDISPHNILINPTLLSVKLIDFGLSMQLNQETKDPLPPQNIEGNLEYIAPEQTGRMNRTIDYRADFYSLGVVFYEMLVGKLPFGTKDPLELIHSHLAKKQPDVHEVNSAVPKALAAIVDKLLAKTPEDRYASSFGLEADLLKCQSEWHQNHKIEPFILGQQDVSDRLTISQKVYAREQEVNELLEAYHRIVEGKRELLLLSGYAGIGKSSIVREIVKSVTATNGYFAKGKYERLNKTSAYTGFIQAFQELIHRLLSEPDTVVATLKENLLKAVGSNGQIIINLIPEVALIIGEQPPVSLLSPNELQNRFTLVFKSFIRVLASESHPLVLFLDDLQWIDSASLALFKSLMSDTELKYFLLIGSYQTNEMSLEHPLMDVLQRLKTMDAPIKEIVVSPFTKKDIQNLLIDSLNVTADESDEFSDLLLLKTQGNPFFINEFLKKLYHENSLRFSYDNRKWQWDLERIRQESVTENVVDLLIRRIQQLPREAQELLELAALVGNTFELSSLSVISEYSLAKTAGCLFSSLEANLIAIIGDRYQLLEGVKSEIVLETDQKIEFRFIHERIQQALYELMTEEMRVRIHLKIGRLLLARFPIEDLKKQDKKLFEILYHFNQSIPLITDEKEYYQLAELNLLAGKKAKESIAHEASKAYFQSGIKLLKILDWSKDYRLLFELHLQLAESLFLLKKFDEADGYIVELLKRSTSDIDSGNIYLCKIKAYMNSSMYREVVEVSRVALKLFNFYIPKKAKVFHILKEIVVIKWRNRGKGNHKIRMAVTDPKILIIGQLLGRATGSAYRVDQNLFAYFSCKLINFGFSKGYIPETATACLAYAIILMSKFDRLKEAFYFVELSKDLQKELGSQASVCRNNFMMGAFINHWKYPLKSSLEYLERGYRSGIGEGELAFSAHSLMKKNVTMYYLGRPLNEIKECTEELINFLNDSGREDYYNYNSYFKKTILLLTEDDIKLNIELKGIIEKASHADSKTVTAFIYIANAELNYIKGDYDVAEEMSRKAYELKEFAKGGIDFVYILLFHGLCLAVNYPRADQKKKAEYERELRFIQKQFKRWSIYNSENFLFGYWLLSAEIEGLKKGFCIESMQLYNKAITESQKQGYTQFVAIANECAARFCFVGQYPLIGKAYLQNAYYAYSEWGALAKCKILEKQYSEILQSRIDTISTTISKSSTSMATANLDILSLLKATQAISGEIQLDKLLKKLISILLQNAGSERAVLLVKEGSDWFVEAEGTLAGQKITLSKVESLKNRTDLPLSLINSVQRTEDVILMQTAEDFESYLAGDLYLKEIKPQSILVLPVFYQGILKNLLYLENRAMAHAFMPTSIQTLKMLASQAAISLENARLYRQATHDPLTGLANRNLLYQTFEMALARSKRTQKNIAILFLDLDGFKKVNDSLGHKIGDLVLLDFSEKIKSHLKETDLAVRLGGDEFVVMLEDSELNQTIVMAEEILKKLNYPLKIQGHDVSIGVSIGISMYPKDGDSVQELLKQADIALYKAKDMGKGRYQFYKPELNTELEEINIRENAIRSAFENNEFCLYYQPVFDGHSKKILYCESLIRWQHPIKGLILPDDFIPLVEKMGLILSMGDWVLKEVFRQMQIWKQQGIPLVPVSINISGAQFKKQNISKLIGDLVQKFQIDAQYIQLEFTENVFIDDTPEVIADISVLKKMGISLAIDDFGTVYSSLSYLRRFPVDRIKISASFIAGLDKNENDRMLVAAVIVMAHSLKLKVTAEGIENESQLIFLEGNGIDELQGFHLEKPMDSKTYTIYLLEKNKLGDIEI